MNQPDAPRATACTECPYVFTAVEIAAEHKNAWGHPCHGIKGELTTCESFRELRSGIPQAREVPPIVKVSEMAKPYTLEQIAEDLANEIYYHQTNNRSRLKQFLIQFAEEIKRQAIEP